MRSLLFRRCMSMAFLGLLQVGDLGIRYTERLFRPNAINGLEGPIFASRITSVVLDGPKAEVGLFVEPCMFTQDHD
jgi:hypothetical protein